jgi:hypothetical protein
VAYLMEVARQWLQRLYGVGWELSIAGNPINIRTSTAEPSFFPPDRDIGLSDFVHRPEFS